MTPRRNDAQGGARNVRTAIALVSVAVVFFLGVILAHVYGVGGSGLTILGLLIVAFLVFAIGRNLASRR
ncbi:MAG: hypothetical protein M3Z31_18930 [Pseudomonadota bacterium]|nr:hypothetical protein [Pseudomonadota bacterium]